jgi:hypothetical protein
MLKKIISTLLLPSIVLSGIFSFPIVAPIKAKASSYNNLAQHPFMGWSSWSSIRKHPNRAKHQGVCSWLVVCLSLKGLSPITIFAIT